MSDIARIELGAAQYSLRSLLDNKPAVAVPVFQAPGSNEIQIADQARSVMEEMKLTMPEGVDYEIVYDRRSSPVPRFRRWCTRCLKPSSSSCSW